MQRAVELFWRQGYRATTPHDLTAALGIGKGSLYNTFGSKRSLFERALRSYGDQRVAGLRAVLEGPGTVQTRLRAALERSMNAPSPGCLAVNTATELAGDPVAARIVGEVFTGIERAFRLAVDEGRASGGIGPGPDSAELASLLLGAAITVAVLTGGGGDRATARRVVDATLAAVPAGPAADRQEGGSR